MEQSPPDLSQHPLLPPDVSNRAHPFAQEA